MTGASLAVPLIGQCLAQAHGLVTKHAVKQVHRLMSNAGIDVSDIFAHCVPELVGAQPDILAAQVPSGSPGSPRPTRGLAMTDFGADFFRIFRWTEDSR
jgi:hypothetical protein